MRWLCLLAPVILFASEEIQVDLRNPVYKNGILYTTEGGVIRNEDIRIQARNIQYFRKQEGDHPVHKIEAEGDLIIQYKGRVYVGSELEYDLIKKTGVVYQGKTSTSFWYIGGDEIRLYPDGSYKVANASFTVCENSTSTWDIHVGRMHGLKSDMIEAKRVRFRLFRVPAFWLPSFKVNLKKFRDSFFRYWFDWDKGVGPRASFRYRLYSWEEFAIYGRFDYRWGKGFGGAIETEYLPDHKRTTFTTRNYLATDTLLNTLQSERRYRVQGAFFNASQSGKTHTTLTWDKYSDPRMPQDFDMPDFEVNSAMRTLFYVHHQERDLIASAKVRARVNPFESIKQDLPTLFFSTRPFEIARTGIFNHAWLKGSYLDFAYSNQLTESLPGFRGIRLELREHLFRPIYTGPLTLTPYAGLIGVFYSDSPSHHPKPLGVLSYGGTVQATARRSFDHYSHLLEPYLLFLNLTRPTVSPDDHYIFSIQDGYDRLNQIQLGVKSHLFSQHRITGTPTFTSHLFANAFYKDRTIPQFVYRLYLDLIWNLPSIQLIFQEGWDFQHQVLDLSVGRIRWTVSKDLALAVEGRYRSQYHWRKADPDSYILDVTRSDEELLDSPISDRRLVFLAHLFYRINPLWEFEARSHHGFLRSGEKPYNEVKIDLYRWIYSALKVRLTYIHTDRDDRVTVGVSLIKK